MFLLSKDQQDKIIQRFNSGDPPPAIDELIELVYGIKNGKGSSKEGINIRKFLATRSLVPKNKKESNAKVVTLTDEQKEYIKNNYKNLGPIELGRIIFGDTSLTNLHKEVRVVISYIELLKKEEIENLVKNGEKIAAQQYFVKDTYRGPKTLDQAICKANKYLKTDYRRDSLSKLEHKRMVALMRYLNVYSFERQMNAYNKAEDRDYFEDRFIRYTYDKEDLTQEEIDQFVALSTECTMAFDTLKRMESFKQILDNIVDNGDDDSQKNVKMGLNEAISGMQKEYNDTQDRIRKLFQNLTTSRSQRLKEQIDQSSSFLNLQKAWMDERVRIEMIKEAERRKGDLLDEIKRFDGVDSMIALLKGASVEELLGQELKDENKM